MSTALLHNALAETARHQERIRRQWHDWCEERVIRDTAIRRGLLNGHLTWKQAAGRLQPIACGSCGLRHA